MKRPNIYVTLVMTILLYVFGLRVLAGIYIDTQTAIIYEAMDILSLIAMVIITGIIVWIRYSAPKEG